MSNDWTKPIETSIAARIAELHAAIALLDNANRFLHTEPETAAAEIHFASQKLDEARGPMSHLVDSVRRYSSLYAKACDLLRKLGHQTTEPNWGERLEATLKALDR